MNNAFALGVKVEYQGICGTITFLDTEYLTICTKTTDGSMTGPVCLVVYSICGIISRYSIHITENDS